MGGGLAAAIVLSATLARGSEEILLWPNGAPGSEGQTGSEVLVPRDDGLRRIAGIHRPSLTPFLPSKERATGAAVIVLPGGGHRYLAIDNEGHAVARWLSDQGIAAFVLKYRLAREEGSTYTLEGHALPDVQRALRLVKSRAREWQLDAARVGLMGFSAGGQLASHAALRFDGGAKDAADPVERESSRPAFQALLYSGSVPQETPVPRDAPPAFLCVAADDATPARTSLEIFQKLRAAEIGAELHVYAKGGHGFGMRDRPLSVTGWPRRFLEWMTDQGFLAARPAQP